MPAQAISVSFPESVDEAELSAYLSAQHSKTFWQSWWRRNCRGRGRQQLPARDSQLGQSLLASRKLDGEDIRFVTHTKIPPAQDPALEAMFACDPVLVDVLPAGQVVPDLAANVILTSGPPLPWMAYTGGQRSAIIGGALHERLAANEAEAIAKLDAGEITVAGCHDFGCIGSLAGVTTASMPVLVVEEPSTGRRSFCSLFEGAATARLNYGVYNDDVEANLQYLARVIAPALSTLIHSLPEPVRMIPIMQRALHMGDELHSRNTAASVLFIREMVPGLVRLEPEQAEALTDYFIAGDYFFLRLSMATSKLLADHMSGTPGSGIVTAMAFSCKEFGIRVSAFGDRWFRGPLPTVETAGFFAGFTADDIQVMGGESPITETCGLGAFAQACAFPLQRYQGGTTIDMVRRNEQMYEIAAAEHPWFKIPYFDYRGTPVGIDVQRVAATGVAPLMDVGIAGRGGGQIGAGCFRAPLEPFQEAARELGGL